MRIRRGITMAMLVVIVAVLGIITTATVVSISNSYTNSKLSNWSTEVQLATDLMKENKEDLANILLDEISLDISSIPNEIRTEQFAGEIITSNKITLKEINLAAIGLTNSLYGVHKEALDIYAYSETTGKVYYLKGIDVRTKVYYTLTEELKNKYVDNLITNKLSLITFEQSEVKLTSNAVSVLVKIPTVYTNTSVTTSNSSVKVGTMVAGETKNTYTVNTTSVKANYTITVSYKDNGTSKTQVFEVKNYDGTKPTISGLTQSNLVYEETDTKIIDYMSNVTATDASGIEALKYTPGTLTGTEATDFFEKNGEVIRNGKVEFKGEIKEYTIYAKDKAGNITILNYTRPETAYAIYSASDTSLRFVRTAKGIKAGGKYNGRVITNLYTGFESGIFSADTDVLWYGIRGSVTNVVFEDKISPANTRNWFASFTKCHTFDVAKLDTSNVTNMSYMFNQAGYNSAVTKFRITGIENFNTANVTAMHAMFTQAGRYATDWSIGDLSGFNTAKVTRMESMFAKAGKQATTFNIGNLDNWNVGKVTNMSCMFQETGNEVATTWNIGKLTNWNTANVTSFSYMFSSAASKVNTFDIGNIGGWNVGKATNMSYFLSSTANNATTVYVGDLSNWNVANCKNMDYMFFNFGYSATTYDIGDIGKWNTSSVTSMNRMFRSGAYKSKTIVMPNFANWDTSKVTNMDKMFAAFGIGSTWTLDLSSWNVLNVTTHIDFSAEMRAGKITEPNWIIP